MATIVLFVCGLLVLCLGLATQTVNLLGSVVYRVLPTLCGAYVVLYAAKELGWI